MLSNLFGNFLRLVYEGTLQIGENQVKNILNYDTNGTYLSPIGLSYLRAVDRIIYIFFFLSNARWRYTHFGWRVYIEWRQLCGETSSPAAEHTEWATCCVRGLVLSAPISPTDFRYSLLVVRALSQFLTRYSRQWKNETNQNYLIEKISNEIRDCDRNKSCRQVCDG